MIRLLFWIGLVVLVVMAIRAKLRSEVRRHGAAMRRDDQPHQAGAAPANAEAMARCAHCHLHFPSSEAVRADGLDYCSPAHVRLPPQ